MKKKNELQLRQKEVSSGSAELEKGERLDGLRSRREVVPEHWSET